MPESLIVIPCYNEESRINIDQFQILIENSDISILFVNDGSTDRTEMVLDQWQQNMPTQIMVHHLTKNVGKAEAVRQGLLLALTQNVSYVGYADADLATPVQELIRLSTILKEGPKHIHAVFGSRIRRLGASINREPIRHYLGRVFATAVSWYLKMPIYDSQCGAKFFRRSEVLQSVLGQPFRSRWIFDVELIQRLLREFSKGDRQPLERFLEVPLSQWQGVDGSKVKPMTFIQAGMDFLKLISR